MTEMQKSFVAAYEDGLNVSPGEAQRRLSLAIVEAVEGTQILTSVPAASVVQIREALERGALSDDTAEALSDELHDYLIAKNGAWFVVKDHEDKLIRAAFEAVYSTVADDGLLAVVADVAALIDGSAAGLG